MNNHIKLLLCSLDLENKNKKYEFTFEKTETHIILKEKQFGFTQRLGLFDKTVEFVYNTYVELCSFTGDLILSAKLTKLIAMSKSETAFVYSSVSLTAVYMILQFLNTKYCVVCDCSVLENMPAFGNVCSYGETDEYEFRVKNLFFFESKDDAMYYAEKCSKIVFLIE